MKLGTSFLAYKLARLQKLPLSWTRVFGVWEADMVAPQEAHALTIMLLIIPQTHSAHLPWLRLGLGAQGDSHSHSLESQGLGGEVKIN